MEEPADQIPNQLRAFLASCVDAVEQLDVLVRLFRWGGAWSARAVAADLRVSEALARHHLETLRSRGLLQATFSHEVSYFYSPRSPELGRYTSDLVEYALAHPAAIRRVVGASASRANKPAEIKAAPPK